MDQLLDTESVRTTQHGRVRVAPITSSVCLVGLIFLIAAPLAALSHSHMRRSTDGIPGVIEKFTWNGDNKGKGNIIGGHGGTINNINGDTITNSGGGMVNKGSNGNSQQNGDQNGDKIDNNDGMVGIGVKQMKACEGSGNDGSGAGAVGTVCCMSPKGPVGCDSAASGGQAIHEHGHAPNRQGQCKLDGSVNGDCTCTWPGGTKWEGHCKNAKKDGKGTVTMRDGTKYVVKYNDDKVV